VNRVNSHVNTPKKIGPLCETSEGGTTVKPEKSFDCPKIK
jgi:hypothetical protein